MTGRTRGRPPRSDLSRSNATDKITARERVAWLLRVSRLHGAEPKWLNLTHFAAALRTSRLPGLSASTVSRWETATSQVPFEAVRGYEALLGLPAHSLAAVADTVFRYYEATVRMNPRLVRRAGDELAAAYRTDEILQTADSWQIVSGSDWDELTSIVVQWPTFAYRNNLVWQAAVRRLLAETIIADGVCWMQRFEAFNRLLAHPILGIEALAALRVTVDDSDTQSLVGTACMFDASAESGATREVIRNLTDPADDRIFKGSLMACVRKMKCGHFQIPQLSMLSGVVADVIAGGGAELGEETYALAVSVLRQIPLHLHRQNGIRILQRLRQEDRQTAVIQENRLMLADTAQAIARRIADHATARISTFTDGYVDPILPKLLEEVLFDPVFDVRLYAASLIYASPYRDAVAQALAIEVRAARRTGDLVWLTTLFEALRKLGGPEERSLVEQFVIDPNVATPVADVAAYALGHIGGTSCEDYWSSALTQHRAAWNRSAYHMSASVLDRLVYAIGMADEQAKLRDIRSDARFPVGVRASASWWLNHPTVTVASSRS